MSPAPLRRLLASLSEPPDAGLTLVECLVSLTLVSSVGLLIGPPLLIASATQQHTRRVHQAQAIAQGTLDQLRADSAAAMALPVATAAEPPQNLAGMRSNTPRCQGEGAAVQANQGLGLDLDGDPDCDPEFILQAWRTATIPMVAVVRVYGISGRREAAADWQDGLAPLRLTRSIGSQQPLAVATTTLANPSPALPCYHDRCTP